MRYRVTVDHSICVGAGRCADIAPSAFELDEEQLSHPLPTAADVEDAVLIEAARTCPSGAISLTGADDEPVSLD